MKYYILAFISTLFLSGCSFIKEPGTDCPDPVFQDNDAITLSFKMISSNVGGTRTDSNGHQEVESEWQQFEDYVNINDFAFFIFLESAEKKPLVMKKTDKYGSGDPNSMVTGTYGVYTVTTVIPMENLEKLLGHKLSPNNTEPPISFRLVILANCGPYDALADFDSETTDTEYKQFMDKAQKLTFDLNQAVDLTSGGDMVKNLYKGTMPMFGMITYKTSENLLHYSRPEDRLYMGDIFLLRSLAKIKVIDKSEKNDSGYPFISSVSVTGVTALVSPLPNDASNYINKTQIHVPNFVSQSSSTANKEFPLGFLNENDKSTFIGYLPEQKIQYGNPVISITAKFDADTKQHYEIPMTGTGYELNGGGFGESILRNHIYTLEVNAINTNIRLLKLKVSITEWEPGGWSDIDMVPKTEELPGDTDD